MPFEPLRAITADAPWQYFEENRKGTLEAGKLADLVILSADPMAVELMKIGDIKVLETIKEGRTVYLAQKSGRWQNFVCAANRQVPTGSGIIF